MAMPDLDEPARALEQRIRRMMAEVSDAIVQFAGAEKDFVTSESTSWLSARTRRDRKMLLL